MDSHFIHCNYQMCTVSEGKPQSAAYPQSKQIYSAVVEMFD